MPSPGEDYQSWSVTAVNNGTADPLIDWHEGQTRASVNNSSRSELAAHAKNRNLLNGSIVTTGSANAQQFLSGLTYTAIPTGLVVKLKVGGGLTNTGSTTLNMDGLGDVLVKTANGDNLIGKEFTADSYTDLVFNGTNWIFLYSQQFIDDQLHGGGGIIIGKQIFATPGIFTYTPTSGMEACVIECIAGGGSGAGVGAATSIGPGASWITGGGGAGGYSRKFATAGDIGASQGVIIGAGGSQTPGGLFSGNDGGNTSVGSLCIANGGKGGGNGGAIIGGGAGGLPGTGDIASAGAPGLPGILSSDGATSQWAGAGGSSHMGGGAPAIPVGAIQATNGNPGLNYGSGGGGAVSHQSGSGAAGGAGSGGIAIITEFAGRGAPGVAGPQGPAGPAGPAGAAGPTGATGPTGPIGPTGPSGPGTGDVLRSGTPTAGQYAVWTDASHIQGVTGTPLLATGTPTAGQYAKWVDATHIQGVTGTPVVSVQFTLFSSSGTYTRPSNLVLALVECIAGGGGGAGVGAGGSQSYVGGGGGSGSYSRSLLTAGTIGPSQTVTIGTGGSGGAAGGSVGIDGNDTSFGALVIAKGGSGGGNGAGFTQPGAGGINGSAQVVGTGSPGHAGILFNGTCPCGGGGSSVMGGGAAPATIGGAGAFSGNSGLYWGGGGSGGVSHVTSSGAAGGPGFQGVVFITEYLG